MRLATLRDIPELTSFVVNFALDEMEEPPVPDEDTAEATFDMLIRQQNGHAMCLVHEDNGEVDGVVCGMKVPDFFTKETLVVAVLYYVKPDSRKKGVWKELAKAFEDWGKYVAKADIASLSCLNPKLERAYKILGYKTKEICFRKELN